MTNYKYAILVGDGMADFPFAELGNLTPLAYASTPNMDSLVSQGSIGLVSTIPEGLQPGSDVANLSLMGYDPLKYYSGRAPIEAASMGVKLTDTDTAFRCNLVTIENNTMVDYSAGHIDTVTAREVIAELHKKLDTGTIHFYPGVSYRHLTVIAGFPNGLVSTPPHDISDKEITPFLPGGPGSEQVISLMSQAHDVLARLDVNKRLISEGRRPVTDIWLWGQGHAVKLPAMKERYGLSGSVISAVDLIRGLGVLAGLQVRLVEGATGYLGTNYAGKVDAAQAALREQDFVYLHVEAPDETSHEGSLHKKIQAIEEFDKFVVGEMMKFANEQKTLRILVAPDHATPVSLKTHTAGPVPYIMNGPGIGAQNVENYCEVSAEGKTVVSGTELFDLFIKG